MVSSVEGHHRVLDLGCGPGIIAEKLAKRGHEIVGVDSDLAMLEYAVKRLASCKDARVERQDANSLSFKEETFDGVVCNNVLYYVETPFRLLKEAFRVLASGGVFSVSGPTRRFNKKVLDAQMEKELRTNGSYERFRNDIDVIKRCNDSIASKGIRNPFDNSELEKILMEVGFSEIITSTSAYLGQNYFVSAVKAPISKTDLLKHDVVRQNVVVSGKIQIPMGNRGVVIDDYEFNIARTPEEMVEIFNLRYRAYSQAGLFKPGSLQAPYDFDKFDKNAVLIYARNRINGRIEATNRLILDSGMGLYLEGSYDISSLRAAGGRLAEGSRLAADPQGQRIVLNGRDYYLSDLVLDRTTEFAWHFGITHILGLARTKLKKLFAKNGFYPIEDGAKPINLKDGKINPKEDLYPVALDVNRVFHGINLQRFNPTSNIYVPSSPQLSQ
ncbi:methyltransferase domain-containing protein [Candidatus Woesearchaeota archaeon]|nr:methyltransferase domain-containing protein [Candidatus Woesearchaeota archaeon]